MRTRATMPFVRGFISSVAFGDGNRFVVGHWNETPIGPFSDVMWAGPSGHRILLTATQASADYISKIYAFDETRVGRLAVVSDGRTTTVDSDNLELRVVGGRKRPIPFPRPLWVTRFVEAPIASSLMGVTTYGVSPHGVREWYQSSGWRWIVDGCGSLDARDLGPPVRFSEAVGVGFSEPPARPSVVTVRVAIDQ